MVWTPVTMDGVNFMRTNNNGKLGYVFVDPEIDAENYQFFDDDSEIVRDFLASLESSSSSSGNSSAGSDVRMMQAAGSSQSKPDIWIKDQKPTEVDKQATDDLLKLMLEPKTFSDYYGKDKRKSDVLNKVADILSRDYSFGERKGGEVCISKLKNLKSTYNTFIESQNKTGAKRKVPPPHFDLMHSFFGSRHSNVPVKIAESRGVLRPAERNHCVSPGSLSSPSANSGKENDTINSVNEEYCSDEEKDETAGSSHFDKPSSSSKVKKNRVSHADILKALQEERKIREESDKKYLRELKIQRKQRKQMISIFSKLANTTADDISSSSEDDCHEVKKRRNE